MWTERVSSQRTQMWRPYCVNRKCPPGTGIRSAWRGLGKGHVTSQGPTDDVNSVRAGTAPSAVTAQNPDKTAVRVRASGTQHTRAT